MLIAQPPGHKIVSLVAPDELQYELTAVLMHSGVTAFSGHYTAHIRIKDHWYSFNDANVSKLKGKRLNLAAEESLDYDPGKGDNSTTKLKVFLYTNV